MGDFDRLNDIDQRNDLEAMVLGECFRVCPRTEPEARQIQEYLVET